MSRPKASVSRLDAWMPLRARVTIALVSATIVIAKFYFRMPLHVPGHSGFFWMALLVVGVGVIRRPGAGAAIGLLSGLLAMMFLPGREGLLVGVKYFVPGVIMDVVAIASGQRLDRFPVAILAAAAANVAKLTSSYLIGLMLGVPGGYLAIGLGLAATSHLFFGALGGWVAALILRRLARAGIPNEPVALDAGGS